MYPRFPCLVPFVYLLSQVLSLVSVFLGYPFLNVSSVFLFGPFSLITFTGCVLRVRVSGLSVLDYILCFLACSLYFTYFHKTQPVKVSKLKGPNRKTEGTFKNR
jgi:hypothetical protein